MRAVLLPLLLLLACDGFGDVQRADTIDGYETWLTENPGHTKAFEANIRLEELYLAKARESGTLDTWDEYLKRWPKGHHHEAALKEREGHLFAWAQWEANEAGWKRYLTEYAKGFPKHTAVARAGLKATAYATNLSITDVVARKINLAEDPEGPLDGMAFTSEITNNGDQTIEALWFVLHYLDEAGKSVGSRKWPVVAPYAEFPVPIEEERTVPMKPGETRTWEWWAGDFPKSYAGKTRLVPMRIRFPSPDKEE